MKSLYFMKIWGKEETQVQVVYSQLRDRGVERLSDLCSTTEHWYPKEYLDNVSSPLILLRIILWLEDSLCNKSLLAVCQELCWVLELLGFMRHCSLPKGHLSVMTKVGINHSTESNKCMNRWRAHKLAQRVRTEAQGKEICNLSPKW